MGHGCYQLPPTGRRLNTILDFHELSLGEFEGGTVYDLGCGNSDMGAELARLGVEASVTGFDIDTRAFKQFGRTEYSTKPVMANLADLPVEDSSATIAIATYSLPMWGEDPDEIAGFFQEGQRVVKPGGIFSVFPLNASGAQQYTVPREARMAAAMAGAHRILESADWMTLNYSSTGGITARKLK